MHIEQRLRTLGLVLPARIQPPSGISLPFQFVQIDRQRVLFSGHGPLNSDGSIARPLGKVGSDLTVAEGYEAARKTALAVLGSLQRAIGDLDRIRAWRRIFGMVNSSPDFESHPSVINGFSQLILELWGNEQGKHTRSAVGMGSLPFGMPVEVEGEVELYA